MNFLVRDHGGIDLQGSGRELSPERRAVQDCHAQEVGYIGHGYELGLFDEFVIKHDLR